MRNLQGYLRRKIVVLHQDVGLLEAASAMKENQIGCVIVCDHAQHLVGIVTDRDLVIRGMSHKGIDPLGLKLSDVMSRDLIKVDSTRSLDEVVQLMESFGVRRVPIVEIKKHGIEKCIGLVTLDDLIADRRVDLARASVIVRAKMRQRGLPTRSAILLNRQNQAELDEFYDELSRSLGSKLEFNRGELEELSTLVLRTLLRRLHRTAAMHFLEQLPHYLYGELLPFVRGPEASATLSFLMNEVCRFFNVDDLSAQLVLARFCAALESWCESKELEHVKAQLPFEFRFLFTLPEEFEKRREKKIA